MIAPHAIIYVYINTYVHIQLRLMHFRRSGKSKLVISRF